MTDQQHPPITPPQPHLGLAGRMAKSFIHSPLSPLLFFAMLFMGILGLVFTPRQEDPQISVPMIDVFIQYAGASSAQVSSLAIDPLQRIMSEIPGVKHVYSVSEHGQGMVTVQFEVGENMETSVFKVHDKLQSNLDKIPPGVSPPLVKSKGIDDVPVVNLTLWSEDVDDSSLRTLALDVMQNLKEINGTGQSFIVGGRAEQVRVEVMPERLSGFGLSLAQVANTIQTANSEKAAGHVESNNNHFTVYTGSFLRTAVDVAQLVVGTHANAPVYVRDVANVSQGAEDTRQMVNYFSGAAYRYDVAVPEGTAKTTTQINGVPAVTIAVAKKIHTNGVSIANEVITHVEMLKGRVIPDNVHVEITRNYGKTANDKVNDLIKKLFIATGAVTILVLFTLGIRPAIVVTLVIPVVILITVFSAWILGFTIDRVSLFALIFSIGILVDDAIVVIENIYRRWLLKENTDTATAVDAVREVGNPTILATFTVVAALLPMGFVSGMMGPYMAPIPALGSVAMLFSLIAAFIFTPWLAMRIKPTLKNLQIAAQKEHHHNERLESWFRGIIPPLFNDKFKGWTFFVGLVIAFFAACSMFYFQAVEVKMLPLDNKPEFNVFVDMPEGTALPSTANLTFQIAEKLREMPEVTAVQTYVGTSQPFDFNGMVRHYYLRAQPWQADIHIQLTDKKDRARSSHEIALAAREQLAGLIKNSPAKITVVEMPPGPPVLQSVVAEIYGPDDASRRQFAQKMTETFNQAKTLADVDNFMAAPHEVWRFEVDTEKAVRRGIAVDAINNNLSMALGGFKLGDIKVGTVLEPTYIVLQVPLAMRSQLTRLYDLPISSNIGKTVPLAELGKFVKVPQDPLIFHKDLRPVEFVVGDAIGMQGEDKRYRLGAPIYGMFEVEKLLKDYIAPDGVKVNSGSYFGAPESDGRSAFEWGGEWTVTFETFRDMGLAFGVALVLIYILVVWQFGNFVVPAVIMAPIPLTLLGIIPGHWLMNASFTATSMIGWIALAGIIVRNSILLVDYSIHELQQGTPLQDAVILACKTRTRPIMITALALVAGSGVILFDPIFQGMAISLLFGVMISTILTLVVIPLGCLSIGKQALCNAHALDLPDAVAAPVGYQTPLWLRIWVKLVNIAVVMFYVLRAIFIVVRSGILMLWAMLQQRFFPNAPPQPTPVAVNTPPVASSVVMPSSQTMPSPNTSSTPAAVTVITDSMKVPPVAMPQELGLAAQTKESLDSPQLLNADSESEAQKPENSERSLRKRVPRRGIRIKSDLMQEQPEETNKDPHPKKNGKD